jgi:hypothetical protein
MRSLFAVTVMAGLTLAIGVLWVSPSGLDWFRDSASRWRFSHADDPRGRAEGGTGDADGTTVEWELLSRPYLQRRLDALTQELQRLDRDPDVFAKAFHTMVARSAHQALLAEASRLAARPPRRADPTFEVEVAGTSTGPQEELQL